MTTKQRTKRTLLPVVGSVTAAATAVAAGTSMTQAAPDAPDAGDSTLRVDASGAASQDTFEPCVADFGLPKGFGLDIVEFDVSDESGDDGLDHDVSDDVEVVLVIEGDGGDVLECIPQEVTEAQWISEYGGDSAFPPYPGPGHYLFPQVGSFSSSEEFGPVEQVGFRVVDVPEDHTLVSPSDVQPLQTSFPHDFIDFLIGFVDERVIELVETEVDAAAAAALEAALEQCIPGDSSDPIPDDPDLDAALSFLTGYVDATPVADPDCGTVESLHDQASSVVSAWQSVAYSEPIVLAVEQQPTPTTTTTTTAPPAPGPGTAADAVTAEPTFTG